MDKSIFFKIKLLFIALCFSSITLYSQNFDTQLNLQDSTQNHLIILKNGKKVKGRILEIQNGKIFFKTKRRKENITLTLSEIQEIKVRGHLSWNKKKYATPLKYSQYLFYKNTGFNLRKGEKSYRTFLGASMLWDKGITNSISIGLGFSFPLLFHTNIKFSMPDIENGTISFKSNFSIVPLSLNENAFFIFENSIARSVGTPDRFFNVNAASYFIKQNDNVFARSEYIPKVYYSISLGGGIRMNENWQFMIENNVNFNEKFIEAKLLPSFGFNYATSKFNFGFGFHSAKNLGFNLYPILETNEDNFANFRPQVLSRIPFFTFSKIF